MSTTTLRDAIVALSEALDPQHQGVCWPDPIAWDGRPLVEQAVDLLALGRVSDNPDVGDAIATLRRALATRS